MAAFAENHSDLVAKLKDLDVTATASRLPSCSTEVPLGLCLREIGLSTSRHGSSSARGITMCVATTCQTSQI